MTRINPEIESLALTMPGSARPPPQRLALNREVPERVTSAIEAGCDVMLVSNAGGVAAEIRQTLVRRLQAAGVLTITRTAPMGEMGPLHDAIRDLMMPDRSTAWTIVLLIDRAEALNASTLMRLQALAAIRRAGRPVLRVILIATPELLPLLENVGLKSLWEDETAHIQLVPGISASPPRDAPATHWRARLTWLPLKPSFGRLPTAAIAGLALSALCVMGWKILADAPYQAPAPPESVEIQTASQSLRPTPIAPPILVAALSVQPPAPLRITDSPLHVTVRYDRMTADAQARARQILWQLREHNMLADGPVAVELPGRSSLAYGFAQDHDAAVQLGRALNLPAPHRESSARGPSSSRPGELSISIGAHDQGANPAIAAARRST